MTAAAWCLLAVLTASPPQQAAPDSSSTIRGVVIDAATSAPVEDAQVALAGRNTTLRTGPDGRFEFAGLRGGTYTLTVSRIGYIFVRRRLEVPANTILEISVPLAEGTGTYQEEVTVAADPARPRAVGVSSQIELGSAGLAELRGVAADDPLRAIQAVPGVATGDDFQAEFSVRGSAFRHVGVVIDGTASPLLVHAVRGADDTGSIAMINTDILARGALLSGPHARVHGDWLGATLEFDVREGSRDRAALRGAVSGTSASAVVEGPIGRAKRGSWLVSIRKSYIDWLIRRLDPEIDSTIGFTDAQAKVVYDLTPRQQLQFTAVAGTATYLEDETSLANGLLRATSRSALGSIAWRYARESFVLTQRVSFIDSDFRNRGRVGQELARGTNQTRIWRADVVVPVGGAWTIEGGARREWQSGDETLRDFAAVGTSSVRLRAQRQTSADTTLASGWFQASRRTDAGGVVFGVRGTDRTLSAEGAVSPWILAERRVGATTVRASAGGSAQFVDPLALGAAVSNTPPERAFSIDVGVEHPLPAGLRLQVTAFHRDESHVLRNAGEYRVNPATGARIVETTFPTIAATLDGASKGVDVVLVRRASSGPTGWIGYTWAHTRYRDDTTGEAFDGDFDQRHTLNVFVQHRISYRTAVSLKLRVGSNFPIAGYFSGTPESLVLATDRNRVRLPVYARLDLRANRTFTFDRRRLTLFAEVMNVLGRRNLGQADGLVRANLTTDGIAERLLPRVPSVGVLIEF